MILVRQPRRRLANKYQPLEAKEQVMMKAALWHKAKDVRVEEVKEPTPGPDEAVLKVKSSGFCGTDLHEYVSGPHFLPVKEPHALTRYQGPPFILGHEFSGEIVETGSKVSSEWKVGEGVALMPMFYCGKCYYCQRSLYSSCVSVGWCGLNWYWGGFGEYTVVKEFQLLHKPPNVSYDQAAFLEPANIAYSSIARSGVGPGTSVLIAGGGPIGCLHALIARAAGATEIFMTEVLPGRLERLPDVGATEVLNPLKTNVADEIKERTNGIGVDVAIDCTGIEGGINDCFNSVRKSGTFVVCGLPTGEIKVNPFNWAANLVNMICTWGYKPYDYPRVLNLIASGRFPVEKLLTKKIEIDDIVKDGFEYLTTDKEGKELKILVSFE
jgi:(R,R)-butanediol dehydrogenase/meso-butanediol dehydrogenase/diacetyl reductase